MDKDTYDSPEGVVGLIGARYIAVRLLSRFERSDSYIDKLLTHELNHSDLISTEKAFLTELVNGVIRWRAKLDWVLTGFYHGDFQKCLNIVKNSMRVGLYQILFLDKIPEYSAINESVEIVKRIQGEKTAGIVNAVLRNIARNIDNIRYPNPDEDIVYYYSIIYSHPKWLVKRWIETFGPEFTKQLLIASNRRPSINLRVNTMKETVENVIKLLKERNVPYKQSPYLDTSICFVTSKSSVSSTELFINGHITVQDTSASLAAKLTNVQPGYKVADVCSAPGGKTAFMAEMMKNEGTIYAIEKYPSKLRFIENIAERMGFTCVEPQKGDAVEIDLSDKDLDVILCDVPCSGLGTLSKKPDIKWKREPEDIANLVKLQKEILSNQAKNVKVGGALVYSTCTIEPAENTDVIKWFIQEHPNFRIDSADQYLPEALCRDGFMHTFPNLHNMDGAFAARLIRMS